MGSRTNAMGGRKLFNLPERPGEADGGPYNHLPIFRAQPSIGVGTTLLAAAMGGLLGAAFVFAIAFQSPPQASDTTPPVSHATAHGDVEAVAMGPLAGPRR